MSRSISTVIVTRNRSLSLQDCLTALTRQTIHIDHLIIINNASTDDTGEVISRFTKLLPLKSVYETRIGYPYVRNKAFREAKTHWIVFLDDDCVAPTTWYKRVVKAIYKNPTCASIIGPSQNYFSGNAFACSLQYANEFWKKQTIIGGTIIDYRVLDSRNIIYNKMLLEQHQIIFDQKFLIGGSDSDVGIQIQNQGLKSVYDKNMWVFHKEPINIREYLYKKNKYSRAVEILHQKWGNSCILSKPSSVTYRDKRKIFIIATRNLTFLGRFMCLMIILADQFLSKINYYKHFQFFTKSPTLTV